MLYKVQKKRYFKLLEDLLLRRRILVKLIVLRFCFIFCLFYNIQISESFAGKDTLCGLERYSRVNYKENGKKRISFNQKYLRKFKGSNKVYRVPYGYFKSSQSFLPEPYINNKDWSSSSVGFSFWMPTLRYSDHVTRFSGYRQCEIGWPKPQYKDFIVSVIMKEPPRMKNGKLFTLSEKFLHDTKLDPATQCYLSITTSNSERQGIKWFILRFLGVEDDEYKRDVQWRVTMAKIASKTHKGFTELNVAGDAVYNIKKDEFVTLNDIPQKYHKVANRMFAAKEDMYLFQNRFDNDIKDFFGDDYVIYKEFADYLGCKPTRTKDDFIFKEKKDMVVYSQKDIEGPFINVKSKEGVVPQILGHCRIFTKDMNHGPDSRCQIGVLYPQENLYFEIWTAADVIYDLVDVANATKELLDSWHDDANQYLSYYYNYYQPSN